MTEDAPTPDDDFISELLADSGTQAEGCKFCEWLKEQPDPDKWVRALANTKISTAALIRRATKDGFIYKKPVMSHRSEKHGV